MNQDFALLPTPAIARRLLLMQRVCRLDLAPEISALAEQDRLDVAACFDPFALPHSVARETITQFLLDCDLRGIVQANFHPDFTPLAVVNAVRYTPQQAVIMTTQRSVWRNALQAFGLDWELWLPFRLQSEDIARLRHLVLIIDTNSFVSPRNMLNIAREFPRAIVYEQTTSFNDLTSWTIWARALFPNMPPPVLARADHIETPLVNFAPAYNTAIFPDLISDPLILAELNDSAFSEQSAYDADLVRF